MKFKTRLSFAGIMLLIFYVLFSCTKDKGIPPKAPPVCNPSFSGQIQPMIQAKCATEGCHTPGFIFGDFTTYEGFNAKVKSGKVTTLVDSKIMPPEGSPQPTDEELANLKCWINNGAAQN